jgi:hypothetical protein
MELDWFFEVYLRQPQLPVLVTRLENQKLFLKWQSPDDLPVPMPIDVRIGEETHRIDIGDHGTTIDMIDEREPVIDPDNRVLFFSSQETVQTVESMPRFPEFPTKPDHIIEVDETILVTDDYDGSGKYFVP